MLTPQLALILCLGVAANARSIVGNTERAVHLTGFTAAGASQTFADENGVADVGKLQAEGNRLIAKYAARRGAKRPMSRAAFKGKRSLSTIPVNNYDEDAYTVSFGSFVVPETYFGAVTSSTVVGLYTGLIGLGFNAGDAEPTIIQSLITSHSLSANQFALFLSSVDAGSEMTIGSVNKARFSAPLATYPVSRKDAWQLAATPSLSGKPLPNKFNSEIDSGTSLILLPRAAAARLYAGVKGAKLNADGSSATLDMYQYPCDSPPTIGFRFHGDTTRVFNVSPDDLPNGSASDDATQCISSIMGTDSITDENGTPFGLLGDAFLRSWYSVYTLAGPGAPSTIGFSKAIPPAH